MAYKHRPEYVTEESQRCEAMCDALPSSWFIWQRVVRRCVKRAQQMRDGRAVCYTHSLKQSNTYMEAIC